MIPLILRCCHTSVSAAADQEILLTDDSVLPDKPDKIEDLWFHPVRLNRKKRKRKTKSVSTVTYLYSFTTDKKIKSGTMTPSP